MYVLHVAFECAPIAKVGGLGDVLGALPKFLRRAGIEAAVLMPRFGDAQLQEDALRLIHEGTFTYRNRTLSYRLWQQDAEVLGFPVYLLEEPEHFGRPGVYQDPATGLDFPDQADRFFCVSTGGAGGSEGRRAPARSAPSARSPYGTASGLAARRSGLSRAGRASDRVYRAQCRASGALRLAGVGGNRRAGGASRGPAASGPAQRHEGRTALGRCRDHGESWLRARIAGARRHRRRAAGSFSARGAQNAGHSQRHRP